MLTFMSDHPSAPLETRQAPTAPAARLDTVNAKWPPSCQISIVCVCVEIYCVITTVTELGMVWLGLIRLKLEKPKNLKNDTL